MRCAKRTVVVVVAAVAVLVAVLIPSAPSVWPSTTSVRADISPVVVVEVPVRGKSSWWSTAHSFKLSIMMHALHEQS